MKKENIILMILLLVGILLVSGCTEIQKDRLNCIKSGGKWKGFSNTCVDSCKYIRKEIQVCGQRGTLGCDCGPEMCWNGTSCESN